MEYERITHRLPNSEVHTMATKEQTAYKDGYKKGFTDGEKGLSELLYFLRCNMTSITRYVRLESGSKYNEKYKALADTAVSNILEIINKQYNCKKE